MHADNAWARNISIHFKITNYQLCGMKNKRCNEMSNLPGYKQCVNDEFCHVCVPPDADVTNLQTLYSVSSVSGRCGANLTKAAKWPPRICVKGRQPTFELGITYQFVEMGKRL